MSEEQDKKDYQDYLDYQDFQDYQKSQNTPENKFKRALALTQSDVKAAQDLPSAIGGGASVGAASALGKMGLKAAAGLGVAAPAAISAYNAPEGEKLSSGIAAGLEGLGGVAAGFGVAKGLQGLGKLGSAMKGVYSGAKTASNFQNLSPIEQNQQFQFALEKAQEASQAKVSALREGLKQELSTKPAAAIKVENFKGTSIEPELLRKQTAQAGFPKSTPMQGYESSQTIPPENSSHIPVQGQDLVDYSTTLGKRTFTQPSTEAEAHAIRAGQEANASARQSIRNAIEGVHPEAGQIYDQMHEHVHNLNDVKSAIKSKNPQNIDPEMAQRIDEAYGTNLQNLLKDKQGTPLSGYLKKGVRATAGASAAGGLMEAFKALKDSK